jgi:hypothetical protein
MYQAESHQNMRRSTVFSQPLVAEAVRDNLTQYELLEAYYDNALGDHAFCGDSGYLLLQIRI